ncbi:hypothetical protein DFJ74DRAFT_770045 [Hyaloraphidium curvatum]|nr:hypothetical protein DFJ74DRAFT_770045 [Hyaloraphidium curvatum]
MSTTAAGFEAAFLGARALGAPETEVLEELFDDEIRRGLSRPAAGHTEDALALQLAVVPALVFVEATMARPGASRNLLGVLVSLWRRVRVPGEAGVAPPRLETVDDLLVWLLWLDLFWIGISSCSSSPRQQGQNPSWTLKEAMAGHEAAVPRRVATPFLAGDLAGLRVMFGEEFGLHEALGFLTNVHLVRMLSVSPEPFVDLAEEVESEYFQPERHSEDDGSSMMSSALVTNTQSDLDTVESISNSLQLSVWFSSTNYATAARAADAIKRSVYTIIFCIAATHGSWIRLLELRHACRRGAQSSAKLERCASLLDDVSACVAVLRASGMPHCAATADTIAAFLDGERTAISRTDLLGLRMARIVTRVCPHGDAAEGGCWACATEAADVNLLTLAAKTLPPRIRNGADAARTPLAGLFPEPHRCGHGFATCAHGVARGAPCRPCSIAYLARSAGDDSDSDCGSDDYEVDGTSMLKANME